jgi:hypothetical protein
MTRDEFVEAVAHLIHQNDRSGAGIKASTLGNLLLRSLSDHWQMHGFAKLKDLLNVLSERGAVRIDSDAQGMLAVWAIAKPQQRAKPSLPSRRLNKDAWAAFVNTLPRGSRFLQRGSGRVLLGQAEAPAPGADWVQIQAIPNEVQKSWAREFLEVEGLNEMVGLLEQPQWFMRLRNELLRTRPDLLKRWNSLRSAKVAEAVEHWSSENNIEPCLLFKSITQPKEKRTQRDRVLDALKRMSTDELLQIPIPAKYIILNDTSRRS